MAISDTQKLDYLFKKLGYGATKTDTNANKLAPNEAIPSPLLIRGDRVWRDSGSIPGVKPSSSSSPVTVYTGSGVVECTEDNTATANRTWKTGLTGWIPPQFGSTYIVSVYIHTSGDAAGAAVIGNKVFVTGSGNNDEWFFDYESGVINFIGSNYPNGKSFSGASVYIEGARYTGTYGTGGGTGTLGFSGNVIAPSNSGDDLTIDVDGAGTVIIDSTTALVVPVGTNAERPGTPAKGMIRFNDDSDKIEVYDGSEWVAVGSSAGAISTQAFAGDGSTTAFTLNSSADSATVMVTLNGVVQEPIQAYSVSGTVLTFTQAPVTGDRIEVRKLGLVTTIRSVVDSDSDTKIQVEEGADDDTIRLDTGGTEVVNIQTSRSAFNNAVQLASMTTAQRNGLTPSNGMVIYNTTTNTFQGYANSTWVDFH